VTVTASPGPDPEQPAPRRSSLGAVHYLAGHLAELFTQAGDASLSLVTRASYDGLEITGSSLAAGPFTW